TLQHHLEACHSGKYCNWAKTANIVLKLPGDIKKWKAAAEKATCTLDHDLIEKKLSEQVVPYLDKLFCRVACGMDQPIQALEHPKFHELIDVTSHATNGVK
ncbi:hypothetical protein L208DRAFT_1073764, partial [Tricholoma matsutake]